jgi:hypothetical protein
MRLFGILLIVFNLLAGAGFVYLSTQDWKGRQAINAAGLRHLLLLKGLPLEPAAGAPESGFSPEDETPFVFEMAGGQSTATVSKKLLESYFQTNASAAPAAGGTGAEPAGAAKVPLAAGAPVVANQVAEARRVWGVIQSELEKRAAAPADQIALLKGWLLFQAETYDLRQQYQALTSPNTAAGQPKSAEQLKAAADQLKGILAIRFNAVLNKPQSVNSPIDPGDKAAADYAQRKAEVEKLPEKGRLEKSAEWRYGTAKDDAERRRLLAHLLVHLDADAAWQKRVMVVVGMRRYVEAITEQVQRFDEMIRDVERLIPEDQAGFQRHMTDLRTQAIRNSERARAVADIRAAMTEQKTAQDDAVSRRATQLKELVAQLNKVKGEVDELLVRQSGIEKQLYEVQREVALTLEEVYRLESLLAATERERYGLPPRGAEIPNLK